MTGHASAKQYKAGLCDDMCSIPELQKFAMDVLSLVAGACSCERNWCAYDFVHSKKRNKLSAEKCEELVYIFSDLCLLRKLTAGDQQELFYGWRKDGEKEAKGGNEKTNDLIVPSNQKNCDTSSDKGMEIESELDSDEISDMEDECE